MHYIASVLVHPEGNNDELALNALHASETFNKISHIEQFRICQVSHKLNVFMKFRIFCTKIKPPTAWGGGYAAASNVLWRVRRVRIVRQVQVSEVCSYGEYQTDVNV